MERLSCDVLLSIFNNIDSIQVVSVKRVNKKWSEIIDDSKSLYRVLILPTKEKGWDLKPLELFDKKSQSSLKQVSMEFDGKETREAVFEILDRSKATLHTLQITGDRLGSSESISDIISKFPLLKDCRISGPRQSIRVRSSTSTSQHQGNLSPLKVLWVHDLELAPNPNLNILDDLVSLVVGKAHWAREWREILERHSQTLKHLHINIKEYHTFRDHKTLSTLIFPKLKFSDIRAHSGRFPNWIEIPSDCTLIIRSSRFLSSPQPPCSRIWISPSVHPSNMQKLTNACPELLELRLGDGGTYSPTMFDELLSMLEQRRLNVEAGMEVEGVKMINIKTLVLPFGMVEEDFLMKLRDLVEEVLDLDEVSKLIDLEI